MAALEYAQAGILLNAVCPGFIHTTMVERAIDLLRRENPYVTAQVPVLHPIVRMGTPAEVAAAVLWRCSAATLMTGQAMTADGGYCGPVRGSGGGRELRVSSVKTRRVISGSVVPAPASGGSPPA